MPDPATVVGDADLQEETTELLQRLIRFNTVNPPGNERAAQEYLRELPRRGGLRVRAARRPTTARPNLVARLRGDGGRARRSATSAHVDTVLATPSEWKHDPWSGELADGFLWGRGALDMKSQVAAEVVAAARAGARAAGARRAASCWSCASSTRRPAARYGAQFLTEQHPDKVRCDYLLNEGGGEVFEYRGRRAATACAAPRRASSASR